MKKRSKLLIVSLVIAGILAVVFTSTTLARGRSQAEGTWENCLEEPGWGHHGEQGFLCSDVVADLLGLTHEEVHAQRLEGKSLAEIAAAQGVSEDALVAAIMAAKVDFVQQRVEADILGQEQADLILQQMEQRIYQMVNQTALGPGEYGGACGFGVGEMWHWGWQDGQEPYQKGTGHGCGFGPGAWQQGEIQNGQGSYYHGMGSGHMGGGMMRW
jgi:hypothetical protein